MPPKAAVEDFDDDFEVCQDGFRGDFKERRTLMLCMFSLICPLSRPER